MSDPSTSMAAPLLENEVATPLSEMALEAPQASSETSAAPERGPPPSFADGYESMGGIPARVMKPSAEDAKFTCHAFSQDGTRLATGESNGAIKIWKTTNYTCVTEMRGVFTSRVECLAFLSGSNNQIVSIDVWGNTRRSTITAEHLQDYESGQLDIPSMDHVCQNMIELLSGMEDPSYDTEILQQRITHLSEHGTTAAVAIISWGARKESCYFTIWHRVYRYVEDSWKMLMLELYNFTRDDIPFPEHFDMESHLKLSRSGNSLIAFDRLLPNETILYHNLGGESDRQTVGYGETCAEWGATDTHVLRWSLAGDDPCIKIYKTEDLAGTWEGSEEIAKLSLNPGLLEVDARIREDQLVDGRVEVFIFEVDKAGGKRILLWDATNKTVTAEINMSFLRTRETADSEQQQPLDRDITFSVSRDGKWVGCLSRRSGACALASVASGTIAWTCDCLNREVTAEPLHSERVGFSPSQRHFLVFADDSILAFAPAVLNLDVPARLQILTLGVLFDGVVASPAEDLRTAQHALACFAKISKLISPGVLNSFLRNSILKSVLDTWFGFDGENSLAAPDQELIDLSVSVCGQFLAYIIRQTDQTVRVKLCTLGPKGDLSVHDFAHLQFPLSNEFDVEDFVPSKLFFYPTGSQGGMILVSVESLPSVLFCDLINERWKRLSLGIEKCFALRQTEDRKLMCFLDVTGVCILDLVSQTVVDRIDYCVNISQLIEETNNHRGKGSFKELLDGDGYQVVSDDGRTVSFAWDSKNKKSLVITPFTEMKECQEWLSDETRMLEFDSDISGDGRCTMRGISDALSVAFCIYSIAGNRSYLARSDLSGEDLGYAYISTDGSLLTALNAANLTTNDNYSGNVKLRNLGLYCAEEQFCPDYQRLKQASPKKVAESVSKLVEVYGVHVLNGPLSPGMTIAQEALWEDDKETVEVIKGRANHQNIELALDWITDKGKEMNLLEEAISRDSTNSIEHVIDLIKSRTVPFGKAAVALKKCWKRLCDPGFRQILRRACSKDCFIFEACPVRVHVKFLDPAERRQTALHLITTDDFLSWKSSTVPAVLEEKWRVLKKKTIGDLEKHGNKSTGEAVLKFVCIEDAAKTGMRGILRPLLLKDVPATYYQTDAVKWVIEYKWHYIWKRRFYQSAFRYGAYLVSVTAYSIILGGIANLSEKGTGYKSVATVLVCLNLAFGTVLFKEEMVQLWTLAKDGKEFLGKYILGVGYYFGSRWNLLDLVICLLLMVCIPTTHFLEMVESAHCSFLSAFTASAAVLSYAKIWYFAQPFQATGAQVLMVDNIVKDSIYFLFLALVILCGFAFGLRVFFRHTPQHNQQELGSLQQSNAPNSTLYSDNDDVQQAYGTALRSLGTLFYALLGDFDPAMYYSAEEMPWLVSALFIIYLIAIVILLLNLLISTMGDTFDRVKSTEKAQLLMGKARFIDACEAALSESERVKIDNETGKYVGALTDSSDPNDDDDDDDEPDRWTGRLNATVRVLRAHIEETEEKTHVALKDLKNDVMTGIDRAVQEQEGRMTTMLKEQEGRMTAALDELEGRIAQNVQQALTEQEGRVTATMIEQEGRMTELMERRQAENNAQMLRAVEESNQANQIRLDELLSLLRQDR